MRPFEPRKILKTLAAHGVSSVVIGGWALQVHGIDYTTVDLDVMIPEDDANHERLEAALTELDARVVVLPGSVQLIRPTLARLKSTTGPLLLETCYGRLDVLRESAGHTFASLRARVMTAMEPDAKVLVAALSDIADMKAKANRPKDRQVLPAIYAMLELDAR